MAKLYKEIFSDVIKEQINAGYFKTKQELITFLHDFNTKYFDHPALMQKLKQEGINLKELDVNAVVQELLGYYDQGKTDLSSLDLGGVTQVDIGNEDYIKAEVDGTTVLLDDSVNKDNFVKQFQDRQNESYNYQTSDGVKNRDEIIEDMKHDKTEVKLISSNNVNTRELTEAERKEFVAVMNIADADEINWIVDPDRNIYINKDSGEIFYARKNSEGKMEVRRAEEKTADTIEQNSDYISGMGNKVAMEEPSLNNLEQLSESDLQYIVDNKLNSLTSEQKTTVLNLLEKRNERTIGTSDNTVSVQKDENVINNEQNTINGEEKSNELENQKVKTLQLLNKPYNGFTSVLYLALTTLSVGICFILYLMVKIYIV